MRIRPLRLDEVERLTQIDATYTTDSILAVEKVTDGLNVTWRLVEKPLAQPWHRREGYIVDERDVTEVRTRLLADEGLYLVAEADGRIVGLLDMEVEDWRDTAMIWNILIDQHYRRQGLGREFIRRAVDWGRQRNLRALVLETQTNNIPACRFYQAMGFQLAAVDDHFYSNRDIAHNEVAIFWYYEL